MVRDYDPRTLRRMDILLRWTIKDTSGKTLWLETICGSAEHEPRAKLKPGEDILSFTALLKALVETSVKDAAMQSATKMSAAP